MFRFGASLLAVLVLAASWSAAPEAATAAPTRSPNIIVIVTDDQPKDTLDAMPNVRSRIQKQGLSFRNGVIPTSICCPSRSSLLTGNPSHTTGVYTNTSQYGAWPTFHANGWEDTNIAVALDDAGYRTALFGKYLNGFQRNRPDDYTPPGWDVFRAFLSMGNKPSVAPYYNYQLSGLDQEFGGLPDDYSTDVIGDMAVQFVKESQAPFFLFFAPYGPHAPFTPAPRHVGAWPLVPRSEIPALNENDISDKPAWVQRPKVDAMQQRRILTSQHEALMSVDDAVGKILDVTDLSNTLVVFMSDNGFMLGTHRLVEKDVPYLRSSEVPMMVRWDGQVTPGRTDRVTPQFDLTALIRDAAGVSLPMEGKNPLTRQRAGVVLEQTTFGVHPAYCGWRSKRYLYVSYDGRAGEEFYDYELDPDELENSIDVRRYADKVAAFRAKAQATCLPTPPEFDW